MYDAEAHRRQREIHWLDHAASYLAFVRDALRKDPQDHQLRELMAEMEAAMTTRGGRARCAAN